MALQKKMGRPPKGDDKQRKQVSTYLTSKEYEEYKEYCTGIGTIPSQDLRAYILSKIEK